MKLACCQFNPAWSERDNNIAKVDQLLDSYRKGDIDILVLPEMAFTGYVFHSAEEIEPYLEDGASGPTVTWAKQQARRLSCYVAVGFPEKCVNGDTSVLYNSQCFINRQGELLKIYRKTFLYETDENWATEGPGFETMDIPELGRVGFGICMDINPYQFKTKFTDFEFASYHMEAQTDIILCSMAWLKSGSKDNTDVNDKQKDTLMTTINYWALRLLPLMQSQPSLKERDTVFVACNRTGSEKGSTFAGGSAVLQLSPSKKAQLLDHLGQDDERVVLVDV